MFFKKTISKLLDKSKKNQEEDSGYGWWLFRKKGTVAEPWPTAEELWNDPKVQKAIKNHRDLIKQRNGSKN